VNNRGVSEALGFVLVFALIIGTISVVYATGIAGLHDAQQAEKLNNVERAFDVLADNVNDIHRSGAPSRATEVKLAGGSIGTGDPVTFKIRAENSSDPLDNRTYVRSIEPIVYREPNGPAILHVQGAVIRPQSGAAGSKWCVVCGNPIQGTPIWTEEGPAHQGCAGAVGENSERNAPAVAGEGRSHG
jgi:hypothetical protein